MEKLIQTTCKTCKYKTYSKGKPFEDGIYKAYCPKLGTKEPCGILSDVIRSICFNCLDYIPKHFLFFAHVFDEGNRWKWECVDGYSINNKKYVGDEHYLCSDNTKNNAEYRYTNWSSCKVKV
jgi:hypothetical protein